jgi:ubiquinone/menaquinone biosynthesis C-methylase UbiE
MEQNIVREMLRVLNPEGFVLWYDYHVNTPRSPDVRRVKKRFMDSFLIVRLI